MRRYARSRLDLALVAHALYISPDLVRERRGKVLQSLVAGVNVYFTVNTKNILDPLSHFKRLGGLQEHSVLLVAHKLLLWFIGFGVEVVSTLANLVDTDGCDELVPWTRPMAVRTNHKKSLLSWVHLCLHDVGKYFIFFDYRTFCCVPHFSYSLSPNGFIPAECINNFPFISSATLYKILSLYSHLMNHRVAAQ